MGTITKRKPQETGVKPPVYRETVSQSQVRETLKESYITEEVKKQSIFSPILSVIKSYAEAAERAVNLKASPQDVVLAVAGSAILIAPIAVAAYAGGAVAAASVSASAGAAGQIIGWGVGALCGAGIVSPIEGYVLRSAKEGA